MTYDHNLIFSGKPLQAAEASHKGCVVFKCPICNQSKYLGKVNNMLANT